MSVRKRPIFTTTSHSYSRFLASPLPPTQEVTVGESARAPDGEWLSHFMALQSEQIYVARPRPRAWYRAIFFGFGGLFFALGILIFFQTANAACGFYFTNCQVVKECMYGLCFFLSAFALMLGYIPDRVYLSPRRYLNR